MGRRRKIYAYAGLTLVVFWIAATFFLSSARIKPDRMDGVREKTFQLKERLGEVERSLEKQEEENKELLRLLKRQVPGIRLPSPTKDLPVPSPEKFKISSLDSPVAILVFACNRPLAIKHHLEQLLKLRPSKEMFPIVVSQDCMHKETAEVVKSFGDAVTLIQQPDQTEFKLVGKQKKFLGYYKISRHYKWAFNQTFFKLGHKAAIVTEDDLDISVDFFEYFVATYPLLRLDPSLWCISAWNDNGKTGKIKDDPKLLYRTDFFPGLGWMLRRETWEELEGSWPEAFWDDWMRKPEQRKERACIRPEISRTAMSKFGKVGVSKGLYFEKHLKHIALNTQFVPFTKMDLSYLLKENFDKTFNQQVYSSPSITQTELHNGRLNSGQILPASVRLTYDNKNTYKTTAKAFGLMDDFRAGVPRTAYRGVVPFMYKDTRVFLAPFPDWTAYDPTWT